MLSPLPFSSFVYCTPGCTQSLAVGANRDWLAQGKRSVKYVVAHPFSGKDIIMIPLEETGPIAGKGKGKKDACVCT